VSGNGGTASGGAAVGGSATSGGALGSGGALTETGGAPATGGVGPGTGGGEPAGGATSTGGSDSGSGGGSSTGGGSSSDLLFHTDFESDTVGDIPATGNPSWTTTLPTYEGHGGIVAVQSGTGHSGSKFIHVKKSGEGQAFLQLKDAAVFPFTGSKIYVRAFMRVSEWPSNHVSWMEVGATTNEQSEMRFGAHQGFLQVNHWPGDQDQVAYGVTFNVNEWACIEYSYEPGTKTLMVWLNDEPVPELTVEGSFARGGAFDPAPPIQAVRFGAEIAANEADFDDIAVSTDFIGCD